jgi:glycosyltransferase involved in cell wall biosynthesis
MKIAVSMIVKNEEELLSRCLDSVKDFDYIVISDTGSEDDTVKIAKKYTDLVYTDYKWEDSFCKARNYALGKTPKDADWILIVDADEYLVNTYDQVKAVLEQAKAKVVNTKCKAEKTGVVHNFTRLFRNDPEIFWVNDVHNILNKTSNEYSDIEIVYGYSPAHKKDPDRALRILTKTVLENPDKAREKYYLAREYYYRKWWQKAIDMYDEYIAQSKFLGEKNDAWLMRARCLAQLGKYHEACDSAWQAIKYNANFEEALRFIGDHMDSGNKEAWHKFADIADNRNVLFVRSTKKEKGAEYYDKIFEQNNNMSRYEDIYKEVKKIVENKKVLDIGCGLSELSKYVKNYRGFDIANKTIEKKQTEGLDVWVGNALDERSYKPADYYVLLEVLEHIQKDREVLELITEGQKVIFSVPSFDDPSHLRVFDEDLLKERYKGIIDIKSITYFVWDKENKRWCRSDKLSKPFILLVEAIRL